MKHPIQKKLIDVLLEPLAAIVFKIPEKARHLIFIVGGCILIAQVFCHNAGVWEARYLYQYTIGCVGFGLMILMLLKPGLTPAEFDYKVMIPWLGLGATVFISGLLHAYDYLPNALLYLIAYPIFFLAAGNQPTEQLFKWLHQISDLSFLVFCVVSLLLFPMGGSYYTGLFLNPNGEAFYLTVPYCCALCSLLYWKGSVFQRCKDFIVLGASAVFMFLCISRTGIMAILGATAAAFVLMVVIHRKEILRVLTKRWVPVVVAACLLVAGAVILEGALSRSPAASASASAEGSGVSSEQAPVEEGPSFLEKVLDRTRQKFNMDRSINQITSGRWYIWKGFLGELNLTGHSPEYRFKIYLGPEYMYRGEDGVVTNATSHMTILQFAYSNGIFAGLCFLLLNVIAGIKSVGFSLKYWKAPYGFFPMIMMVAFVLTTLFASCSSPFNYIITFYYFASLSPLMVKGKKIENQEEIST